MSRARPPEFPVGMRLPVSRSIAPRPCTLGPSRVRCISPATVFFTTREGYVAGCDYHAARATVERIWLGMVVRVVHDGIVKDGTVAAIGPKLARVVVRGRTGAVRVLERDIDELLAGQPVPS